MSRLVLIPDARALPPARPDTTIVVLDTAWTPTPGERADVVGVRAFVAPVLERIDLFAESLRRLDAWAAEADLRARLDVGGFSAWYALREELWYWLHERLLWRLVIAELVSRVGADDMEVDAGDDDALAEVAEGLGTTGIHVRVHRRADPSGTATARPPARPAPGTGTDATPKAPSASRAARVRRRILRLLSRGHARVSGGPADAVRRRAANRLAFLDRRIRAMVGEPGGRVLVLSYTAIHQQIGGRATDPNLGAVIERLRRDGPSPVVIGLGLDHRDEAAWPAIEADDRLLPGSLLGTRWHGPDAGAEAMLPGSLDRATTTPLLLDAVDVGPALAARVAAGAGEWLPASQTLLGRVGRLLAELRPSAVLLTHEGIRAPWIVGARAAGIPTYAVQHGMLYDRHPGYCRPRDASLALPDRTFVYGPYEQDVLLRHGGYRRDEIQVTGSPRTDLDQCGAPGELSAIRASVREELGVRDGDRLVVVSTAHVPLFRRFYLAHFLERTLGGPLPGVHLVIKQHPGERDDGPYRQLIEGLAHAGGYAPPVMSVVRDIDLYRLLRGVDAHLGFHSTMLTDAVFTGTPNLIAIVGAFRDPLGWVAAGVARPVTDVADVRDALANPEPPDAASRQRFLNAHFMDGDAGARITAALGNLA